MSIEKTPQIDQKELLKAMLSTPNEQITAMVNNINDDFEYWDTVKYKKCPNGYSAHQLWTYVKAARIKSMLQVWKNTE